MKRWWVKYHEDHTHSKETPGNHSNTEVDGRGEGKSRVHSDHITGDCTGDFLPDFKINSLLKSNKRGYLNFLHHTLRLRDRGVFGVLSQLEIVPKSTTKAMPRTTHPCEGNQSSF